MSRPPRRRTVPTRLAAMAAGVSEATIRKWASRGKICRYGRPGRAEYDVEELLAIVTARLADERRRDAVRERT
ncbi:MAG TPA: hypothetical protein VFX70_18580 [Mycobacteriales bacterium]|nr:hypothetical protein [Mycobacteriales bacterium]